jgi:mersacidin/lichenicidin family type 2 lantibiotic
MTRSRNRGLNKRQIARAWADPAYRASLTEEQRQMLPAHPSGTSGEEALDEVRGWGELTYVEGCPSWTVRAGCCTGTCATWCTCESGCTCPYSCTCCCVDTCTDGCA